MNAKIGMELQIDGSIWTVTEVEEKNESCKVTLIANNGQGTKVLNFSIA